MVMNGGWSDKQGALSGLHEIVNFSFLELLSHRIPVSKAFKLKLYTNIFFNYSSLTLPNVLWAELFSDEITCGRLLFRENFAMDGLRVAGTDTKEMKLGLTEDTLMGFENSLWFKVKISSSSITHRGLQAHFSSEVVFWWDVDLCHVSTLVSLLDYLQSMPR